MRYLRTALFVLLFAALLILFAVCALFVCVTPERTLDRFNEAAGTAFGLEIECTGLPQVKRLPQIEAVFPNVRIFEKGSHRLLGSAREIRLTLPAYGAFAQVPKTEQISIFGFETDTAQFDFGSALGRWLQASDLAERWVFADGSIHNLGAAETEIQGLQVELARNNDIPQLSASGTLTAVNASGNFSLSTQLARDEANRPFYQDLLIRFQGLWRERSISGHARIGALLPDDSGWSAERTASSISLPDGLNASLHAPKWTWNGTALRLEGLSAESGVPLEESMLQLRGTGNVFWMPTAHRLEAEHLVIESGLSAGNRTPSRLEDRLAGSIRWDAASGASPIKLEGTFIGSPLELAATVDTSEERPILRGTLALGRLHNLQLLVFIRELSEFGFDLNLALSSDKLDDSAQGGAMRGTLNLTQGTLQLTDFAADLWGGKAAGAAAIRPDGSWSGEINVRAADASKALRALGMDGRSAGGLLDAKLSTDGPLSNFTQTIEGTIRDGHIAGFSLDQARDILIDERSEEVPAEIFAADALTAFRNLRFSAARRANEFTLTSLELDGERWKGSFSGKSTPEGIELDGAFLLEVEGASKPIRLPASALCRPQGLPEWKLSWAEAAAEAEATLGPQPYSLSGIAKRIRRSFKNFWDGLGWPDFKMPEFSWDAWKLPDWSLPEWRWPKMPWDSSDKPSDADSAENKAQAI